MTNGLGETGVVLAAAWRARRRAPMCVEDRPDAVLHLRADGGPEGDHKGERFPDRGVTLLSEEGWMTALEDVALPPQVPRPHWSDRRANLLIGGLRLPHGAGSLIALGEAVVLEVTRTTTPCRRMEEAVPGLLKALHRERRGGVTARVLTGGEVTIGEMIRVIRRAPDVRRKLP